MLEEKPASPQGNAQKFEEEWVKQSLNDLRRIVDSANKDRDPDDEIDRDTSHYDA